MSGWARARLQVLQRQAIALGPGSKKATNNQMDQSLKARGAELRAAQLFPMKGAQRGLKMDAEAGQAPANWGEGDIGDQTGKVVFITGANIGLGFEAARMLSERGARILMACRDESKAREAMAAIKRRNGRAALDFVGLDLADLEQVAGVPEHVKTLGVSSIDVLLNNAGVMMPPKRQETKQGYELQFGVNHLAHFALTRLLFPMLAPQARVVTVASIADRRGDIRWDDPQWRKGYTPSASYGQSKTANLLFTLELSRRLQAAGSAIMALGAHPGVAMTNLATSSTLGPWLWLVKPLVAIGIGPKVQSPAMGALPEVYAAVGAVEPGAYFGPAQRTFGPPARAESHKAQHSGDAAAARRLWSLSEELTGAKFEVV
ncbi:oxidoreductase [Candidatus Viadribacter manganicus]|uniref:Short-chain dehydrogenase n=1 Tax=Candidatus Viadribacter manganicus TaxID=1759059 RepID=A0A1B1AGQ9_9PROT|nr:oxidoreductase [Candidatus Viadribacter manganicus]ANP45749.1 hypothetical protein ATE48_07360 [Candidatus Viadribacter manganicus]